MLWRLSDGTTVELGGKVEGATVLAQRLRALLERGDTITVWPHPAPALLVDVNDPALVNAWVERQVEWWRRARKLDLRITERPDNIPPLPPAPWEGKPSTAPDDAIY